MKNIILFFLGLIVGLSVFNAQLSSSTTTTTTTTSQPTETPTPPPDKW